MSDALHRHLLFPGRMAGQRHSVNSFATFRALDSWGQQRGSFHRSLTLQLSPAAVIFKRTLSGQQDSVCVQRRFPGSLWSLKTLRFPGLPLGSRPGPEPTPKLSQAAAPFPAASCLITCFHSHHYVSSQTPFLDCKHILHFLLNIPLGHLIETPNSIHWLPWNRCYLLCAPISDSLLVHPRGTSVLPQHWIPLHSLNIPRFFFVLFVKTRISLHQYLAWKTYSMSPPLVTFPHSSRMDWASKVLFSGVQTALVIYDYLICHLLTVTASP